MIRLRRRIQEEGRSKAKLVRVWVRSKVIQTVEPLASGARLELTYQRTWEVEESADYVVAQIEKEEERPPASWE